MAKIPIEKLGKYAIKNRPIPKSARHFDEPVPWKVMMKQGNPEPRRLKVFSIEGSMIVGMLHKPRIELGEDEAVVVNSWRLPEVPEDAKVWDVHYRYDCQCWDVIVEHPSFPEVPQGELIPRTNLASKPVVITDIYVPKNRKPLF